MVEQQSRDGVIIKGNLYFTFYKTLKELQGIQ